MLVFTHLPVDPDGHTRAAVFTKECQCHRRWWCPAAAAPEFVCPTAAQPESMDANVWQQLIIEQMHDAASTIVYIIRCM